jgi:hypothetical protein
MKANIFSILFISDNELTKSQAYKVASLQSRNAYKVAMLTKSQAYKVASLQSRKLTKSQAYPFVSFKTI